jgi:serine/threonine protein kinase
MPILKERYEFEPNNRAGKGGFGSVYKAKDIRFDRWVALKFADKVVGEGKQEKYSLFEEANRAIRLRHRCLAEYIYAELVENHDSIFGKRTEVFVVMEWIEGVSLTEFFQKEKPSLNTQLDLLNQILRGLRYLHKNEFIHRDLTPNNIMVTQDGDQWQIKIIDLGISKKLNQGSNSSSVLVGTPNYMSPEQFDAEEYGTNGTISFNSDLWSLGIIWHELVNGQLPFGGNKQDSTGQIIQQILQAPLQIKAQHLAKVYQLFFEILYFNKSYIYYP